LHISGLAGQSPSKPLGFSHGQFVTGLYIGGLYGLSGFGGLYGFCGGCVGGLYGGCVGCGGCVGGLYGG